MLENQMQDSPTPLRPPCVYLVCGSVAAGKTCYATVLAEQKRAVLFSLEKWLSTLFGPDGGERTPGFTQRIERCEEQIWQVAEQLLLLGIDVVLDLGFFTHEQRKRHRDLARTIGAKPVLHFLDHPPELRRARVFQRNCGSVFSHHATAPMFDIMESRFEPPDADELAGGARVE